MFNTPERPINLLSNKNDSEIATEMFGTIIIKQ